MLTFSHIPNRKGAKRMNNNTEIISRFARYPDADAAPDIGTKRPPQSVADKAFRSGLGILLFLFAALIAATPASAQPTTPIGVWLHDNQRIEIEIAPCGEK